MSMQVHEMAIAVERRLLSGQAERGWQIEQAATWKERPAGAARPTRVPFGITMARLGQALRGIVVAPRPAIAQST